jgi:hypothetical protein
MSGMMVSIELTQTNRQPMRSKLLRQRSRHSSPGGPSTTAHGPLQIPLHGGFLQNFPLVMQFAAAAQTHQDFGDSTLVEIDSQRHERETFLVGLPGEFAQLTAVYQQLAGSPRFVVPDGCLGVLRYIAPDKPEFPTADAAVGLFQRDLAVTQTLHLAADQCDTAFQRLKHLETMARLAVFGNRTSCGPAIATTRFMFLAFGHPVT